MVNKGTASNKPVAASRNKLADFSRMVTIEISKLKKAEWNYKTDDPETAEKLEADIKEFGQIENIIVRELAKGQFEVVNGNHRLDAFKKLGIKLPICFNLGKVSLEYAQLVATVTNELRFGHDELKLSQILSNISKKFTLEKMENVLPWEGDKIKGIIDMLNFDFNQYSGGTEDEKTKRQVGEQYKTILLRLPKDVAEKFDSEVRRFKKLFSPDQNPDEISYIGVVEAMLIFIANVKDSEIKKLTLKEY